jgi:hypothetical protein
MGVTRTNRRNEAFDVEIDIFDKPMNTTLPVVSPCYAWLQLPNIFPWCKKSSRPTTTGSDVEVCVSFIVVLVPHLTIDGVWHVVHSSRRTEYVCDQRVQFLDPGARLSDATNLKDTIESSRYTESICCTSDRHAKNIDQCSWWWCRGIFTLLPFEL